MKEVEEATVQFYAEDCEFQLESETKYQEWILTIANEHNAKIEQLNYIFSSDEYVLELNKSYLEHDYFTDILSFPLATDPIQGDIFISIDRVKDNAKTLEIAFQDELHRVMAHGLLHLIGFDDHNEKDKQEMRNQEEKAMALFV